MERNSLKDTHIYRIAAWMWIGYLATLAVVNTTIYTNLPASPVAAYSWANGLAALIFLGLSYSDGVKKHLGRVYSPLMIALISAIFVTWYFFQEAKKGRAFQTQINQAKEAMNEERWDDAREFLAKAMTYKPNDPDAKERYDE